MRCDDYYFAGHREHEFDQLVSTYDEKVRAAEVIVGLISQTKHGAVTFRDGSRFVRGLSRIYACALYCVQDPTFIVSQYHKANGGIEPYDLVELMAR